MFSVKLKYYGFSNCSIKRVRWCLSDRHQFVCLDGKISSVQVISEVRQGSILIGTDIVFYTQRRCVAQLDMPTLNSNISWRFASICLTDLAEVPLTLNPWLGRFKINVERQHLFINHLKSGVLVFCQESDRLWSSNSHLVRM